MNTLIKNYEYDFLTFIGRFQPFHNGHKKVIETALKKARRVVVVIGSANRPRTFRNPFTYNERAEMILNAFPDDRDRISITKIGDHMYNDTAWIKNVHNSVRDATWNYSVDGKERFGLIGFSKDNTSYYLNLFPGWSSENVHQTVIYNATDIRQLYFTANPIVSKMVVPASTRDFMEKFVETPEFKYVVDEWTFIQKHNEIWANSPFIPTFQTADALVTQGEQILVVERKASPGKGLLALPGGYLKCDNKKGPPDKNLFEAAIRELHEETRLKVPKPVLIGSFVGDKIKGSEPQGVRFSDPNRSERGRIITEVFHFVLKPQRETPKVKGGDDASKAFFMPISMLRSDEMFEDHFFIIEKMLGIEIQQPDRG